MAMGGDGKLWDWRTANGVDRIVEQGMTGACVIALTSSFCEKT